ncbi:MAG: hypothetical protein MIO92_01305 [Methanosarcinaceae archaeon]|nr:hypothetical protein [Methanosarcinaceae archaeon]
MAEAISKNIDQIVRTKTALTKLERMVGRDSDGDFKITVENLMKSIALGSVKETSVDYTIQDDDYYTEYIVNTSGGDVELTFPSLSTYAGPAFTVKNKSGDNDVICIPDDSDLINDYNANVEITENWGWWRFTPTSDEWAADTDGNSTIYEVSSETADTGLSLNGTWDDVSGMVLTLPVGKGLLSASCVQDIQDTSVPSYIYGYFGLGITAGNNAPDIPGCDDGITKLRTGVEEIRGFSIRKRIVDVPYESAGVTIYMKASLLTDEMDATTHTCSGNTNSPMFIKWRRTA